MLVFVDESGDTGLKMGRGSSRFFTVGLVLFNDMADANACDQRIRRLREELGYTGGFEFHFKETSNRARAAFFTAVAGHQFFYFAVVINKSRLFGPGFAFRDSFYKYTCGLVFENAKPHLDQAIVVLDASGSKRFQRQLAKYLKTRINSEGPRFIKKVKAARSSGNNLVQLADMVTGAVNRSLAARQDSGLFRDIIKHREIYVQQWPR